VSRYLSYLSYLGYLSRANIRPFIGPERLSLAVRRPSGSPLTL